MRTVTFDLQGHGSAIEAVSLLSGYKLVEPTEPTAEGWSFGGWYTDEDFTDGNEWDFDSSVTSDMTLYALWTQGQMYRVTLPENMIIVSADNAAVGGKYPSGTNIRFKAAPDYVVDGDVKNGTETLTADEDGIYTVALGNADITITATIKKAAEPNKTLSGSESYTAQNGDVLTGSTSGTVTIPDGASITLSDVSIGGGIVCNGTATITLVGTNSATGATQKAGIEVGGENTTLTIKGNGSLTATGGQHSAGISLSRAWDPANDVIGGDFIIEGGTITANGGYWGAGIGTGVIYGNGSAKTARLGNITIKGGTVKATGGTDADGIGTGYTYSPCTNAIGTVTVYDGIDKVDASSIKDFTSVVYMHSETNVTANKTDYFTISEDGDRRVITQKHYTITVAGGIENGRVTAGKSGAVEGDTVTLTITPVDGYSIGTVSYNDTEITANNGVYSFTMPAVSVTISVTFTPIPYTITYNLDGGSLADGVSNPASYTVEDTPITLTNPAKDGYTFKGWTGTDLTEATQTVTIAQGSTGNRAYSAVWEQNGGTSPESGAPKFKYQALVLDGKIAVRFAMDLSSLDETVRSGSYMMFDISGDRTSNNRKPFYETDSFTDGTGKYYYFDCGIKSIEMANNIRAEFYYGDGLVVSKDYTARQYLNDMLADEKYAGNDDYSVAVRNLMKAIKDYGHYAQLMLSAYRGWSLGGDYAPIENENTYASSDVTLVNSIKSATEQYAFRKTISGSDIEEVTFSLALDSYTTINVLVNSASEVTASLKNGGGLQVVPQDNNRYLIELDNIPAHELTKTFDVVINAGNSSCEVNVSAMSYVYAVLTDSTDYAYEPELAAALYKYYEANQAYRTAAGYSD